MVYLCIEKTKRCHKKRCDGSRVEEGRLQVKSAGRSKSLPIPEQWHLLMFDFHQIQKLHEGRLGIERNALPAHNGELGLVEFSLHKDYSSFAFDITIDALSHRVGILPILGRGKECLD